MNDLETLVAQPDRATFWTMVRSVERMEEQISEMHEILTGLYKVLSTHPMAAALLKAQGVTR
jgi:lipocalin